MKRIYVAGPIRARNRWETIQNIRRAEAWSIEIMRAGGSVYCPHTMDQNYSDSFAFEQFLTADFAWLIVSDAVFMVPGWEASEGSRNERAFAAAHDIPVFEDFGALCAWIQVNSREE